MSINNELKKIHAKIKRLKVKVQQEENSKLRQQYKEEIAILDKQWYELHDVNIAINNICNPLMEVICRYFFIPKGRTFKTYVSFQELINYKCKQTDKDYETEFKYYIVFIDELKKRLAVYYPFINFDGIDLSWTTDQLKEYIVDAYFTRPVCNVEEIQKAREEKKCEFLSKETLYKLTKW